MKTTNREAPQARRVRLEAPQLAQIDLSEERRRVRLQSTWQEHGHGATTLFKYPDLRGLLIGMKPGARMREHQTEGRVTVQCLSGHVHIHALGRVEQLTAGRMLTLERVVVHEIEAVHESDLLMTIAMPKPRAGSTRPADETLGLGAAPIHDTHREIPEQRAAWEGMTAKPQQLGSRRPRGKA